MATKQASNKTTAKPDVSKAAKERALLVDLLGPFDGEPKLHHYESACTVLAARVDDLVLKATACRDKTVELLTETVLDDSPEIFAAIDTNREAAEQAEREAEVLGRSLAFFQKRAAAAKAQATAAQINEMRGKVGHAGAEAIAGGASIDALLDEIVEALYALGDPLKALFQVSPREIVTMEQVKAPWLFAEIKRGVDAHARGTLPLPSVEQGMRDVAAVARRSFDEQHPQQQEA